MSKTSIPIAFVIALTSASVIHAESPGPNDLDVPLDAILRRKDDVLVSTSAGIYWADVKRKEWQKVLLAPEMPTRGQFGIVPEGSQQILYYTAQLTRSSKDYKLGIYGSTDAGRTWRLHSEKDDCGPVTLLENGALFAVSNARRYGGRATIEVSRDMGKTWRDITGESFGTVHRLFPDPDHVGLICLEVNSVRNYILQADDENYLWKATALLGLAS